MKYGNLAPVERNMNATSSSRPTPMTRPRYPAMPVTSVDSSSNVLMMENGVAPSALRMPISLVRSFTVMIMMLLMPTMPAINVPRPTNQMNTLMPVNSPLIRLAG